MKYWWDSFKEWYTDDWMRAFYFTWVAVGLVAGITLGECGLDLAASIVMIVWFCGNMLMTAFIMGMIWEQGADPDDYHTYLFRVWIYRAKDSAERYRKNSKVKMYDWVTHEEREYKESELFDVLKKRQGL